MSKLLIEDNPMIILPSLAKKIGLNQAIVIQQFHYWLVSSKHTIDGRKWIYNSYKKWEEQFVFWSGKTIERTIRSLEEQGYLQSANYNRSKQDKTKWYTINYAKLAELDEHVEENLSSSKGQIAELDEAICTIKIDNTVDATGLMDVAQQTDCLTESDSLQQPLPEIISETNSENKMNTSPFTEIITYLNDKTNSNYKLTSKKTRELIRARLDEAYQLEDFKKVIEIKSEEWRIDPVWSKYLRPETLFGTKFESYLNQKSGKKTYREEDFNLDD
ncbi:conserved phage C-terminal domain-containing protein [Niallia sp. Krafla_26]|uniref:conserved phage C-terminal domain-containing protein n=1 Tax=Niallia sp. Krafla_26 TaxID=3064703 RepID=UPI003D165370